MSTHAMYGLIGYPVKHSFSPAMHNAAFASLGIDARYSLFEVKPEDLSSFFSGLDTKGILGLNITVPYKEAVLNFVTLDRESAYLKRVKAVNTAVKRDGAWKGFNTDIPGFARHLRENTDPAHKRTAVLGAGGAARAVTYVLADSGADEIAVFDVDQAKARGIAAMIKEFFPAVSISTVDSLQGLRIPEKDILINATPVGMKPSDPCLVDERMLHPGLFVYDLIYNPPETTLLKSAKKRGARTSNGLGMLLYQGALAFECFTGRPAPIEVMRAALEGAIAGNLKGG